MFVVSLVPLVVLGSVAYNEIKPDPIVPVEVELAREVTQGSSSGSAMAVVTSSTQENAGQVDANATDDAELKKMMGEIPVPETFGSEVVAFEHREGMEFLLSTGFVFQDLLDPEAIVSVPNE